MLNYMDSKLLQPILWWQQNSMDLAKRSLYLGATLPKRMNKRRGITFSGGLNLYKADVRGRSSDQGWSASRNGHHWRAPSIGRIDRASRASHGSFDLRPGRRTGWRHHPFARGRKLRWRICCRCVGFRFGTAQAATVVRGASVDALSRSTTGLWTTTPLPSHKYLQVRASVISFAFTCFIKFHHR